MSEDLVEFDIGEPIGARAYIEHFKKNVFKKDLTSVKLKDGEVINLKTMSDEEAIGIAHGFYFMEFEAHKRNAPKSH